MSKMSKNKKERMTTVEIPVSLSERAGSQASIGESKWQVIQMWAWSWENPKKAVSLDKPMHKRGHMSPRFSREENEEVIKFIQKKE